VEKREITALRFHMRRQLGLFTLAQALSSGFARKTLRRWLANRMLDEVAPRVYRFPGSRLDWHVKLLAFALSADALAARLSAAALYGAHNPPKVPQLLVVRGRRNLDRVEVHSTLDLPSSDITRVGVIPATTPIRTLIDAAADLESSAVEDLVDKMLIRRLVYPVPLERRARELCAPARPGAARVLRTLATRHPDLEQARNEWEARVLRLSRRFGLPDPVPNLPVIVGGRLRFLDSAWSPARVDLEFDGFLPHLETRKVFDDDRARQNDLVDDDWKVFRVTSTMLRNNAAKHFEPIARAVSQRWGRYDTSVGHSGLAS
jgi:hypothetical protein